MTDYKELERHDMIQRLQKVNGINPYYRRHDRHMNAIATVGLIGIGMMVGMVAITALKAWDKPERIVITSNINPCGTCHSHKVALVKYFDKAGSKTPEHMAEAVLATKSPRLLAAIAKVETGGNTYVRGGGYKKRHDGAFQVNPKHWGKVPYDAVGQALQAEKILTELTEEMPIKKALNQYGGDSKGRYAKTILAELSRVP